MIELRARIVDLAPLRPAWRALTQAAYRRYVKRAEQRAVANVSGPILKRRTGELAQSIRSGVEVQGLTLRGFLRSDVPQAVHEVGASIPARLIRPVRAAALHWVGPDGRDVFAMVARPGAFTLPARPFMRPALEAEREALATDLAEGTDRLTASLARQRPR